MIHWYRDLYMDDKVRRNPKRCKRHVEKCAGNVKYTASRFWKNYYAIVLPSNEANLYDIVETRQLYFRWYAKHSLYVAGLAKNRDTALELLQQIIRETIQEGEEEGRCGASFTLRGRIQDKKNYWCKV